MPRCQARSTFAACLFSLLLLAASDARASDTEGWRPSSARAVARALSGSEFVPATTRLADPQSQPGPEPHPPPEHTGFRTLVKDTLNDFKAFPKRRSTWVILGVGAGLAALAHPLDDDVQRHFAGSNDGADAFFAAGKFLGAAYTQIGVALGMYAVGRWVIPRTTGEDQTNKWSHLGFDLLRAHILSQAVVHGLKYTVRRDRPTGECCSFPSGHAAAAFAVASVIERHLGYRFAWPTVAAATYVATSRLVDNRHYLSDVVFGSAIGVTTGWTIVGRHGRNNYAFIPTPVRGGVMLTLTRRVE